MADEPRVQTANGAQKEQGGDHDPPSHLDVHASATLDRLTRWAAKALRAPVAVVTLSGGEDSVIASHTGLAAMLASPRLRTFEQQIRATGEPRAVADLRREPEGESTDGIGVAFLGAPLVDVSGAAVGSFCVMDMRPRRWTIQDIELVNELSASAMTELQVQAARNEAAREKRWSDRQQVVLELIAARAPLARTLTELLDAAEMHAPRMLAAIARVEKVRGGPDRLRIIAGHGVPRGFTAALDGVAVGEGTSISGTAAARRQPVVVADIASSDLSPAYIDLAAENGLQAGWSTPILARGGAVLGTFTIYYGTARPPNEHDRLVIARSVHLARLAIEQVDGAEALRRNASRARSLAREQTALQRVATQVAGEANPQILFALVAEQVGLLLKADAGYVLRFEDEDRYRNVGSWARDRDRLQAPSAVATHLPDGICGMLRTARTARRCAVEPDHDALGFKHRIAAPVLVEGGAWGLIVALRDGREFRREDEKRLVRFAQLAGVAVANARAHEALATQARTDPLTGLANRRAFDDRLAEETERAHRHKRDLSVMLVDVDHFKTINDRFGHAAGDHVLVNLADSLRAVMRNGDLLARIGGDEMAMILPDCPPDQAALVAQRMIAAIGDRSSLARRHGVTVSAGVAGLLGGNSAEDLLRYADQALYGAKDEGRNQVVSYDPAVPGRADLRMSA
ncbi:MAG TPA: diguanylate cyclase [Solirubrobacteraceae bacterium]|nr:diguanylate cyclase [Solirubrobacteraceae bacterium]